MLWSVLSHKDRSLSFRSVRLAYGRQVFVARRSQSWYGRDCTRQSSIVIGLYATVVLLLLQGVLITYHVTRCCPESMMTVHLRSVVASSSSTAATVVVSASLPASQARSYGGPGGNCPPKITSCPPLQGVLMTPRSYVCPRKHWVFRSKTCVEMH